MESSRGIAEPNLADKTAGPLSFGDGPGKDVIVVAGAAENIPHDMIIGPTF